jgi:capsular exopolysaccharide synthesis family protein
MSRNFDLLRNRFSQESLGIPRAIVPSHSIRLSEPVGSSNEAPLTAYVRAVWNKKWTVLVFALAVTAFVAIISFLMKPTYEGVARIAIYKENQGLLDLKQGNASSSDDADYTVTLDTQAKIIESDAIASRVIRDVGLDRNPDFIRVKGKQDGYRAALEKFHNSLRVVKVPHTRLLEVRFSSSNPKLAADVANAIANTYIDHTFEVRYEATMLSSKRLSDELSSLQDATNRAESKLLEYQRTHRMVGSDELINSRLSDLNKDLTAVEVEKTQKQAEYNMALAHDADRVGHMEPNSLLDRLRDRESQLSIEYAKMTSVMGDANPQVIETKNQLVDVRQAISTELDRMKHRVTNDYLAIASRENWLRQALEQQKQEAAQHNQDAIEYDNLKREADTNRQLYTDLLQKLKEAQVAAGLKSDNVRVEGIATVPQKPSQPDIPFNTGMALFGGLIGGIILSLVRDTFDDSVRNVEQAETISGAPALVAIPKAELSQGDHIVAKPWRLGRQTANGSIIKADPPMIESYRALRTLALLQFSGCSPHLLLFTSSLPGEGKTTTAVNTSIAFAQNSARVLLVDADMRNSSVHKAWGFDSSAAGLSTVLAGQDKLEEVLLQAPQHENLYILPAGPPPGDPCKLLSSEPMKDLLSVVRQGFDYVIVDAPPVLGGTDTLVLAGLVDAVLVVVREMSTPKQALARTRELLVKAKAPEIGVVLNGVEQGNLAHNYYYPYSSKQYRAG